MVLPRETTRHEALHDNYGAYPLGRLKAEPETQSIAPNFETAQKRLEDANGRERAAYRALQVALAAREAADERLDTAVRSLETAAHLSAKRNRESSEYRKYFATRMSAIVTFR